MPQPDFGQVCNQFRQFRQIVNQALAAPGDAAIKQQLQSLSGKLDDAFVELQTAYPKAQATIDAQLAGVHKSAEQTTAKLAGLKESIAAASAAAVDVSAALPVAADPDLGQKLREELLSRFGRAEHQSEAATTDREIWQDWDWQDWSNN